MTAHYTFLMHEFHCNIVSMIYRSYINDNINDIQEFDKLKLQGGTYRLHKLGNYHVVVFGGNFEKRRHVASVVPPLYPLHHKYVANI